MMAFVDDKRHYTKSLRQQLSEIVIKAMEQSVSTWYELLLFVVGDLALSKCGCYVIDWGLEINDKPQMQKTKHNLWITTPSGSKIPSQQLDQNAPSTYLGVTSQIDGDHTTQLSKLRESVKELSKKLSTCHMPHHYGHLYQQYFINPKLSYPLLTSSPTDKKLDSIQKIIHPSVIAAKGFNRNWPIPLRYGKHKYCGLEMLNLKIEQRLRKHNSCESCSFINDTKY